MLARSAAMLNSFIEPYPRAASAISGLYGVWVVIRPIVPTKNYRDRGWGLTQRSDPQRKGSALAELETPPHWHKSSLSGEGDCLEWVIGPSSVRVRHSKDRAGPQLVFTHSEWAAFVAGAKRGEADLQPDRDGRWNVA